MDNLVPFLREKRRLRDEEFARQESQRVLEYTSRQKQLQKLKDQTNKHAESIVKNLNVVTGHKHAVTKVVHESKEIKGLAVSNKHHKQTVDFINNAIAFLNNENNLDIKPKGGDSIDACKLSANVQSCAQSSSDLFKGIQSSVVKAETLTQNIHVITDQYNEDEQGLDKSIFDK